MKMNRIKEVLQEKGLTQVWLAAQLGKCFKMVNAYACNRKQPSLETLFRIADLLDVNVKDLIVDNKKNKYGKERETGKADRSQFVGVCE